MWLFYLCELVHVHVDANAGIAHTHDLNFEMNLKKYCFRDHLTYVVQISPFIWIVNETVY